MASVRTNIVWNLLGSILPFLAGLIVFPLIISSYGIERFGILTLAWAIIGYFSLFDLGLGRALIQIVSVSLAKNIPKNEIAELIRTGFRLMWLLGIVGGVLLWLVSPYMVTSLLKVNPDFVSESMAAFSVLAFCIPIVVHTSAMRGVLESLHLFKVISLIRMVMGVGTFVVPYIASLYSNSLSYAIHGLILIRIFVWILYSLAIRNTGVLHSEGKSFASKWMKPLFSFGGWMTITNVIGPIMVYMDRFLIVAVLGAASVSFYVAPYEVITKMWVIPAAISGVLFPLFAKEWDTDPKRSALRLDKGIKYTFIAIYPASVLLVFFASEWLSLWLGDEFSFQGRLVVVWLVAGVFINSISQIVFANVQGAGRSDLTAKLHLVEILPYLALLWWALHSWGIAGAAFVWFVRVVIDLIGLIIFVDRIGEHNLKQMKQSLWILLISTLTLLVAIIPLELYIRVMFVLSCLFIFSILLIHQVRKDGLLDGGSYMSRL